MTVKKIAFLLIMSTFILTGCGQSAEESIHEQLEETVTLEAGFREQQSDINELEQKEKELYEEIIELGTEDLDQIIKLAEEAEATISVREEKLKLEKESIELAKESFQSIDAQFSELNETVQPIAEAMYTAMEERYLAYDELYDAYLASLASERELYKLLQEADLERNRLNEQIEAVNKSYENILTANEKFNTYTNEYNTLRIDFYEAANIDVTIVDDDLSSSDE